MNTPMHRVTLGDPRARVQQFRRRPKKREVDLHLAKFQRLVPDRRIHTCSLESRYRRNRGLDEWRQCVVAPPSSLSLRVRLLNG